MLCANNLYLYMAEEITNNTEAKMEGAGILIINLNIL